MKNRNRLSAIVFSVYIVLAFYVFGAGIVNSLVGYRTWRGVGAKEFRLVYYPRFNLNCFPFQCRVPMLVFVYCVSTAGVQIAEVVFNPEGNRLFRRKVVFLYL